MNADRRRLLRNAGRTGAAVSVIGLAGCDQPEDPIDAKNECDENVEERVEEFTENTIEQIEQIRDARLKNCDLFSEPTRTACRTQAIQDADLQLAAVHARAQLLREQLSTFCDEYFQENRDDWSQGTNEQREAIKKAGIDALDGIVEDAIKAILGEAFDREDADSDVSIPDTIGQRATVSAKNARAIGLLGESTPFVADVPLVAEVATDTELVVSTTDASLTLDHPALGERSATISATATFDRRGATLTATSLEGSLSSFNLGAVDTGESTLALSPLRESCGLAADEQLHLRLALDLETDFLPASFLQLNLSGPIDGSGTELVGAQVSQSGDLRTLFPTDLPSVPVTSFGLGGVPETGTVEVSIDGTPVSVTVSPSESSEEVGVKLMDAINDATVATTGGVGATFDGGVLSILGVGPERIAVDGHRPAIFRGSLAEAVELLSTGNGIPLDGNPSTAFDEVVDCLPYPAPGVDDGRECYEASETHYLGFEWSLPLDHANEIQSDSFTFDLGFYAEQCRHNDGGGM
jgi:hypothetical protein